MMSSSGFYPSDAPAFRTKYGHELKTQKWYRDKLHLWNDPIHTGTVAWRLFHAPRIAQDLGVKLRLDEIGNADADRKQHLTYLKHVHDESRMRKSCQSADQALKQTAQSFEQVRHFIVPRLRSDFSAYPRTNSFSDFTLTVDKFRKQAVTQTVMQRDAEALDNVRKQLETENAFAQRFEAWKQHRHDVIIDDFRQRQQFIDKLSRLSGQLVVHSSKKSVPRISDKLEKLAKPRQKASLVNAKQLIDCKGLLGIPRGRTLPPLCEPREAAKPKPDFSATRTLITELQSFEDSLQGSSLEPNATGSLDFISPPKKTTMNE